jgi:hypothetical protein
MKLHGKDTGRVEDVQKAEEYHKNRQLCQKSKQVFPQTKTIKFIFTMQTCKELIYLLK